ncbi:MAG: hypothetical protein IIX92_00280 [Selenomonadales bacterium]|jgi:hypothetical protein|nr:hypothetical protein [Selenomonadales bacterium]MBQ2113480.1 hypothetical protein [Selenomonadales bacterium]MBQ2246608.1 hypothetical protein [Selenomonadales bacterium]MBQ5637399.1 hypothetical protein [Selenomonadales bacterium]MBQ5832867.1 hypothetical protein [Selenomonadales bacterium]
MNHTQLNSLAVFSQIADLKETDYKTTLAITALIELLITKNIITPQELRSIATDLEHEAETQLSLLK